MSAKIIVGKKEVRNLLRSGDDFRVEQMQKSVMLTIPRCFVYLKRIPAKLFDISTNIRQKCKIYLSVKQSRKNRETYIFFTRPMYTILRLGGPCSITLPNPYTFALENNTLGT